MVKYHLVSVPLFQLKCIVKPYLLANTQILRYYVKPMFFHGKFPLIKCQVHGSFSWQFPWQILSKTHVSLWKIFTGKMPFSKCTIISIEMHS